MFSRVRRRFCAMRLARWTHCAGSERRRHFCGAVKTAPTLVKYATPNDYLRLTRDELTAAAAELMAGQAIEASPVVDLLDDVESLEVELATSLLYPHCHYRYRQLRRHVADLSESRRSELIASGCEASRAA